ncbi:L1 [Zalophus californianus papillomavirus 1]|uniref:Major capsid protein L1 n=1 Tax=Zalophus californianus papillomavirus 1 TaxID=998829 RepID=F2X1C8_9PAPI|nr:L1 [Zalophus californianus papillomavirus 1]ADZ74266.1 L1 [Zalophus californianus papillomavirus 1]
MAFWKPNSQKLFLPPTPVSKVRSTDEYVQRLGYYYHAESDRLLTVGHPFWEIRGDDGSLRVPKVSPNQYRVFRVTLPDPNAFAFSDGFVYNPDSERLVWAVVGLDVSRGQPLGTGVTGHPLLNRLNDVENPSGGYKPGTGSTDSRGNVAFDVKQSQILIVGCRPAMGEHWHRSPRCANVQYQPGDCPGIELRNTDIQDGDMGDMGYGAMDFGALQENKSEAPLDAVGAVCKYPDYLKMAKEATGDALFFFARREQQYLRHFFSRGGDIGDVVPDSLYLKATDGQAQATLGSYNYWGTPSGSLVSSDAQLFNRPYWIRKAQGQNNGVCWGNQLFVTVLDNTRGVTLSINVTNQQRVPETYNGAQFKEYMRHAEEYELTFIFQLCRVSLTPEVVSHLQTHHPSVVEGWNLGVQPPPSSVLEDTYRYITSRATRCPENGPVKEPEDPYASMSFWSVDLRERFSNDLDQFPLGRKFLSQAALPSSSSRKRPAAPRARATPTKRKKR